MSWGEFLEEKLRARAILKIKCDANPKLRKQVLKSCKEDFEFFCDNFLYAYDPRKNPSRVPFILYPKQREMAKWFEQRVLLEEDGFIDKPRDVGATVVAMAWVFWKWLFYPGFACRVGSRKEQYVDKLGDQDTLFAKLDFYLEHLPSWMIPKGFRPRNHRTRLALVNPSIGSTITGESSNSNFSRGGRQTVVLFDELAFWDEGKSAWESAGDATNTRICMTTPPETGKLSFVYKLREGEKGEINIFEFEYTDVPHKTKEWLEKEKGKRSREEFEREVLKSYAGRATSKVYADDYNQFVKRKPDLIYRPSLPLFVSWDFGLDMTSITWWQKDWQTNEVYLIDCYEKSDKTIDFFYPFLGFPIESGLHEYTPEELRKIVEHSSWAKGTHFGDISGENRSQVSKGKPTSVADMLRGIGIYVQSLRNPGHGDLKEKTKLLFRRMTVNNIRCEAVEDALLGSRYPNKRENSEIVNPTLKPVHDEFSHYRTSVEYFALNEPQRKVGTAKRFKKRIG